MTQTQTADRQHDQLLPGQAVRLRSFIEGRLVRGQTPQQVANAVFANFDIAIDSAHVIPFYRGEITLPTQTGHRQDDKESVQFPADAEKESVFTLINPDATAAEAAHAPFTIAPNPDPLRDGAAAEAGEDGAATQTGRRQDKKESVQFPTDAEEESVLTVMTPDEMPDTKSEAAPAPVLGGAPDADAPATQTGRRQDEEESLQIPADEVDAPAVTREARAAAFAALGAHVKAKLGIEPDPAPAPATQTGRRQNQTKSVLTDEIKAFIVRGLARYETPTRVAASVQAQFGIAIDRRQVYAYDPAGSRPPAQRWIDLHKATRAKFIRAASEIGIAQKVVRLRMLDRFANRAEEGNYTDRAAKYLEQAAKECGGFYERYARPKAAAAPSGPTR